ncbi:hypothetical protein BH10PLA1_BH10PLA1_16730 [soil metagenome]
MTLAVDTEFIAPTRPSRGSYLPYLDGIRGIAILLVIGYHAHIKQLTGGYLGVDVFFVLSGFLITSLLIKEWNRAGRINLGHFYMRRALRLLPAVVLLLIVYVSISWFVAADFKRVVQDALISLFYCANWARAMEWRLYGLGHTWSLSSEEQFYMLWPLMFIGLMLTKVKPKAKILFIAAVAAAGWRIVLLLRGASAERLYNGLDTHADALLIGCGLAFFLAGLNDENSFDALEAKPLAACGPGWIAATAATIFLLVMTVIPKFDHQGMFIAGYFAIAIASAIIVWDLRVRPGSVARRVTEWGPLVKLGRISYGVYLWHYPILQAIVLIRTHLPKNAATQIGLFVGGSLTIFFVAELSYRFVEMPFLRLKGKFK